jgi:hypothetical protein
MKRNYFTVLISVALCTFVFSPAAAQEAYEVEYQTYKDFRFSIGGGYAFRLGKIEKTGDSKIDNLSKQLRNGFTVDADAQYFFKETWGLGLNANYCSSTASGNDISFPNIGNVGKYKESQNMLFVGPSYAGRNESEKFLLVSSIAIGPLFYMNEAIFDGRAVDGTATTVGVNAGVAGEYKLNGKTGIGIKLSYTIGTVNSLTVNGKKEKYDKPVNVSNLMFTGFISFRSW